MEIIGYLLLASLFLFAAHSHVTNNGVMRSYTLQSMGSCPVGKQIAWFGGWPTGVYLAVTGALLAFQNEWGLGLAAGFLAVSALVFHRNLKDVSNIKHIALLGAVLALLAA